MIVTKFTFHAQIVFTGEVEEVPSVQAILDMLKNGKVDIDYIDLENTIGANFVIMVKPKDQPEMPAGSEDIPF